MSRCARSLPLAALVVLWCAAAAPAAPPDPADDGPGALSHFDLARKDCVGTARNTTSKVWFTVANGVLSDVYFPTNDNTNVETLQYIVTDGSSFTDLQTRDTTYTVKATDDRALTCRVTTTAKSGRYKIVTDYTTDPSRPTVLIRSKFVALEGKLSSYRLYVRHDPTLNGNGGGGTGNGGADTGDLANAGGHTLLVGSDTVTQTNAANRDYAIPVYSALDVSRGFEQATNGFAGQASDGLAQLDADHALSGTARHRAQGNLVQVGRVALGHDGELHARARLRRQPGQRHLRQPALAQARLRRRPPRLRARLERLRRQAREAAAARTASRPSHWNDILDEYYLSANYVKAAEDKTFPGAVAAALTSPWGQAVSAGDPANTYFGSYREVFARDLYEAWTALFLAGDRTHGHGHDALPLRAPAAARRLDAAQQPAQRQARARQLQHPARRVRLPAGHGARRRAHRQRLLQGPHRAGRQLRGRPRPRRRRTRALGGAERLLAVDHLGRDRGPDRGGDHRRPQRRPRLRARLARRGRRVPAQPQEVDADHQWAAQHEPYFIRLSKTGDPNAAITYDVGNGGPTLDQRAIIDAGFLEYARLGLLSARDADIIASLPVVDATIKRSTASGDGFLRYNGDGYGDGSVRRPSVGARRNIGQRPPVAGARRRARPVRDRPRLGRRCHRPPGRDAQHELGRRPHRRAGVGAAPTSRPRPSAPIRRSPRSASATASPPARRRP